MEYIDIEKHLIPYEFEMSINNNTYRFEINYNNEYDFFTLDLYRGDEVIFVGEKIVYGKKISLSKKYSSEVDAIIKAYDLSVKETRVSWDNLNETVFLYILEGDSNE